MANCWWVCWIIHNTRQQIEVDVKTVEGDTWVEGLIPFWTPPHCLGPESWSKCKYWRSRGLVCHQTPWVCSTAPHFWTKIDSLVGKLLKMDSSQNLWRFFVDILLDDMSHHHKFLLDLVLMAARTTIICWLEPEPPMVWQSTNANGYTQWKGWNSSWSDITNQGEGQFKLRWIGYQCIHYYLKYAYSPHNLVKPDIFLNESKAPTLQTIATVYKKNKHTPL